MMANNKHPMKCIIVDNLQQYLSITIVSTILPHRYNNSNLII